MAQTTSKTKTGNATGGASAAAGKGDALTQEISRLIGASKAGELTERANAELFEGAEREMVEGINEMLDAIIGPLNVSAEYVDRISKGDMPEPITDEYQGDFNEIKDNLNTCIEAIGQLATRADASKHQGDYAGIIEGMNGTLDAVVGPLNVSAEYVDRISKGDMPEPITDEYQGDFNEIKDNLNTCIEAIGREGGHPRRCVQASG